jgi:hypothetical protein
VAIATSQQSALFVNLMAKPTNRVGLKLQVTGRARLVPKSGTG